MNRRAPRTRLGHDRWLVSYADFITLMFAFFVVLYSFERSDAKKQTEVSAAISAAFRSMGGHAKTPAPIEGAGVSRAPTTPAARTAEEQVNEPAAVKDDLERLRSELAETLKSQIASHALSLEMGRDGLVISLREAGFFASGSAEPKTDAMPTLRTIAAKLGSTPYDLRVEGHTDNVPIHNAQFASNWELSAARATGIARLFLETKTIAPERVSAAGYAEFHPVASNETEEGRGQNRRVDLVVMPRVSFSFGGPNSADSANTSNSATPPAAPSQ